jgi:hypothetical protein
MYNSRSRLDAADRDILAPKHVMRKKEPTLAVEWQHAAGTPETQGFRIQGPEFMF